MLCCLLAASYHLFAQKLSVGYIYPAGAQRGTTAIIEIGGLNLQKATDVIISGEGVNASLLPIDAKKNTKKRKKLDDQSSPQLADRVQVKVEIKEDAPIGLRELRLQSAQGVSNKLFFEVGQYPDVKETPGSTVKAPNKVTSLPATLCGQIMPGEIDYFQFNAKKGQQLVIETKARIFVPYIADAVPGWFQPVMRLQNKNGREIAFCDDYKRQVDPVIIQTIPADGSYILSIHDAIFRGREDFNYRIQIGQIPFIQEIFPNVGTQDKNIKLQVEGANIGTSDVIFKPHNKGYTSFHLINQEGKQSNEVPFFATPKKVIYPNSGKQNSTLLADNYLFDYIKNRYDANTYKIPANKGELIVIEMIGSRNGSLIDGKMTLRDSQGNEIASSDDVEDPTQGLTTFHSDPAIHYQATQNDTYTLEVEDVLGQAGKTVHFLLCRSSQFIPFTANVSPATLTIPAGGSAIMKVSIQKNSKKVNGRWSIELKGLPKGYTTSLLNSGHVNNNWEISVTAPADAKPSTTPLRVIVHLTQKKSRKEETELIQEALPSDNMMQAFYYTHHISSEQFIVETREAAPYTIQFKENTETIAIKPGQEQLSLTLKIDKHTDFNENIELALGKKLKSISMLPVNVSPDEKEKRVTLNLDWTKIKNAKFFRLPIYFIGSVKGEIEKKGKRTFQNAKYQEISPIILIEARE